MLLVGVAVSIAAGGISADALAAFFAQLAQAFTLDDEAKGILDNDFLLT